MDILYYPGCTLNEYAKGYDASGRSAAGALGVQLKEIQDWTCCGTTLPLTTRLIAGLVAPVRTLVQTERAGHNELLTLCSFCYNVLKRANHAVRDDTLQRQRLNAYLADEYQRKGEDWQDYSGNVQVLHLLEVLRDRVGFERVKEQTRRPLEGLRVATYYGCMLLRPHNEVGFDDPERPRVMEDLLEAIGCEVVDFPHRVECCGSYLGLTAPDVALETSFGIVQSAQALGAEAIVLACPLCAYNLDTRQAAMHDQFGAFSSLPVLYFTELMTVAFDDGAAPFSWGRHATDPRPLLQSKHLV